MIGAGASLAQTTMSWSTEVSSIGEMLTNPQARAVFRSISPTRSATSRLSQSL